MYVYIDNCNGDRSLIENKTSDCKSSRRNPKTFPMLTDGLYLQ